MTSIVAPLAITVVYANKEVTTHDTTLTVMLSLECCRKTSKKKHVRFVSLAFSTFVAIDLKEAINETLFRVELRLFTVLYFCVRSSRSSALCYGLPSCMSVKTT